MASRFYIVDDDQGIRRILSNIVEDYDLGVVIGKSGDGKKAVEEILNIRPDIVFVDLLLPYLDGIEIIKKVRGVDSEIQFIMISEVSSEDMVSEAYKNGVEFYINKPINVVEVVSITKRAQESQNIKRILKQIGSTIQNSDTGVFSKPVEHERREKKEIVSVFTELGILGEAGCNDLINIIEMIMVEREQKGSALHKYNMKNTYKKLSERYEAEKVSSSSSVKAIEQRVRRTIQTALNNIANIGLEDFGSYKFEKYSTSLFDFKEVRNEMDYLRSNTTRRGKVNAKTFIEGIINEIQQ